MSTLALHAGFLASAASFPERTALEVGGESYSYAALRRRAQSIAATLARHRGDAGPPLTCVLGESSATSFAAILGVLCSGHAYVPVLPTFPTARISLMLERARARALVVDAAGFERLPEVLVNAPEPMTVLLPDQEIDLELRRRFEAHTLLGASDLLGAETWSAPEIRPDDLAYILFTSGSTGRPKGVMVTHANIAHFLDTVVERYGLQASDRFSHMFDLTFDLSLFDMFAAWKVGGCLCCPGPREKLLPARFVNDAKLTIWFSVPSTALLMKKTRTLDPGSFPGLRWSLFCGEALPVEVARAWMEAAPDSRVENIYGPTELTLACTAYRCDDGMEREAVDGIVPIGAPFPGMSARVVDEELREVQPGQSGELIMTGPQLTPGYWEDEERTQAAYVHPPDETRIHYRTGDRVRRPEGASPLIFLGRVDQQIKVRGYRVELGEIEAAMREEGQVAAAIAVGWPPAEGGSAAGADGIVGFVDDPDLDSRALIERMSKRLPKYMLPKRVIVVDRFPLNVNGKIDRRALLATLQ